MSEQYGEYEQVNGGVANELRIQLEEKQNKLYLAEGRIARLLSHQERTCKELHKTFDELTDNEKQLETADKARLYWLDIAKDLSEKLDIAERVINAVIANRKFMADRIMSDVADNNTVKIKKLYDNLSEALADYEESR